MQHATTLDEVLTLRSENAKLRLLLEVSEACNIAKTETLLGVEIALARDEDIDGAMKIILAAKSAVNT